MKKIHYFILSVLCSIILCTALNAQDSLNKAGYDKAPPPANPKQLNRTPKGGNIDTKATSSKLPPGATQSTGATVPGYDKAPPPQGVQSSNGYVPGKASNYGAAPPPKSNAANPSQDNYDDVPANPQLNRTPSTNRLPNSNGYGKVPANNAQGNNTQNKSQYQQIPVKPKNEPDNKIGGAPSQDNYDDVPGQPPVNRTPSTNRLPNSNGYGKVPTNNAQGNNAQNKSQYQQIPLKPKNEPDNKIGGAPSQDGYDDVPNPPAGKASNSNVYDKVPPINNPKQLNKTTASKDLNTQVQQKATNQYGPPPVSGSAAAPNPKSQYGPLPPAGRTQQYGTVPPKNTQGQVVNQNNTVKPPAAAGVRTQQYGTVPVQPKTTTSTPPQKAPPPTPTVKKGSK